MSDPVKWETRGGAIRWQPARGDDVLVRFCAAGYCANDWHPHLQALRDGRDPVAYRWKWRARLRGRIGEMVEAQRISREWVDTEKTP